MAVAWRRVQETFPSFPSSPSVSWSRGGRGGRFPLRHRRTRCPQLAGTGCPWGVPTGREGFQVLTSPRGQQDRGCEPPQGTGDGVGREAPRPDPSEGTPKAASEWGHPANAPGDEDSRVEAGAQRRWGRAGIEQRIKKGKKKGKIKSLPFGKMTRTGSSAGKEGRARRASKAPVPCRGLCSLTGSARQERMGRAVSSHQHPCSTPGLHPRVPGRGSN